MVEIVVPDSPNTESPATSPSSNPESPEQPITPDADDVSGPCSTTGAEPEPLTSKEEELEGAAASELGDDGRQHDDSDMHAADQEYTALMTAIDELQNVLFEEEMKRLEAARKLEEKEALVTDQMQQLQKLTDMLDVYDDELHMMKVQLEDLLVMKHNMKEEMKSKEHEMVSANRGSEELCALLMSRDMHLAEMKMLVKQLEADPNFELIPEKPAKIASSRGFFRSMLGSQQQQQPGGSDAS